jgi:vitamin B12 transporter
MPSLSAVSGLALVLAPLTGGAALAAEVAAERPPPETVVVSALRLEQPASEAGVSVGVITSTDIERRSLGALTDALATLPGVTIAQSGAFGGVASVRIRGAAAGQTVVLVDGVNVNDAGAPGGGFDASLFDLFDIERIEVLRGPQSTLWGSDAIGGVVSIRTTRPGEGPGLRAFAEAGSYDSLRGGAVLSGRRGAASARLSGVWTTSAGLSKADERDGARERDGLASAAVSARGDVDLSQSLRAEASLRWSGAAIDFDGFPPPDYELADTDDQTVSNEAVGVVRLLAGAPDGQLSSELELSGQSLTRENEAGGLFASRNEGRRTTVRYTARLAKAGPGRLAFGLEREDSEADGARADTHGLFGLYEWTPGPRLSVTGGLRIDEDSRFGSSTTGRLALSADVGGGVRLRAAWGQGFKAPTLFQANFICSFCGLSAPNRDLRPERSEALEAGLEARLGEVDLSVTLFEEDMGDLIDFSFARGYDNIETAHRSGAEASLGAPLSSSVFLRLAYAYIDARDAEGQPLPRAPRHSGDVELSYAPPGPLRAALSVRGNGRQSDGFGPDTPGWLRADLALQYDLTDSAELYARIENLTDEAYQQVGGYGTPGRSARLGVRIRR